MPQSHDVRVPRVEVADKLRHAKSKTDTLNAMRCPVCGRFLGRNGRCRQVWGDEHS